MVMEVVMTIGFIGQRYGPHSPAEMHDKLVAFFMSYLNKHVNDGDRLLVATGAGVDLPMIEAAKNLGVPTQLVIPFPDHTSRWQTDLRRRFEELEVGMDKVVLTDKYTYGVYDLRNLYIAKHSNSPLLVFWDGVGDEGFGRVLGIAAKPGATHTIRNLAGDWVER